MIFSLLGNERNPPDENIYLSHPFTSFINIDFSRPLTWHLMEGMWFDGWILDELPLSLSSFVFHCLICVMCCNLSKKIRWNSASWARRQRASSSSLFLRFSTLQGGLTSVIFGCSLVDHQCPAADRNTEFLFLLFPLHPVKAWCLDVQLVRNLVPVVTPRLVVDPSVKSKRIALTARHEI